MVDHGIFSVDRILVHSSAFRDLWPPAEKSLEPMDDKVKTGYTKIKIKINSNTTSKKRLEPVM